MSGPEYADRPRLAVILGAVAQGSVGFGFGMLAAPVLALVDKELVPGAVLLLGLTIAVAIAWNERGALDWLGIRWALVGRVLGTVAGAYAVTRLDHDAMAIALGVDRPARRRHQPHRLARPPDRPRHWSGPG